MPYLRAKMQVYSTCTSRTPPFRCVRDYSGSKYAVAGKWFLDDNLDNVLSWSYGNPCMNAMLWNTRATRDLGYERLREYSWDDIIAKVKASL